MFFSQATILQKYRCFYDALHRVCIEKTKGLPTDYADFFSRLQAVCRLTNYPLRSVDAFRWRARLVLHGVIECDEHAFLVDTRAFVDAMAHFTDTSVPAVFRGILPDVSSLPLPTEYIRQMARRKRLRFVMQGIDDEGKYLLAVSSEMPSDTTCRIDFAVNAHTLEASHLLKEGMHFNILSFTIDHDGVYHPTYIVIEPDYLIDTTTVTNCIKPYGDSAFNHLLSKFGKRESTVYTILGDFANQFLDDALNLASPDYLTSMRKLFAERAIDISACEGIDSNFFAETQRQFANIKKTVADIHEMPFLQTGTPHVYIEPSFFCEALGLQGRMDCLICIGEGKSAFLIELKSGKWDEYRNRSKDEHMMQMLLYKEILFYNSGIHQSNVMGNLLYSRYPKLQEQRSYQEMVMRAINIRNNIISLELALLQGKGRKIMSSLSPESFRLNPQCSDMFWLNYALPPIKEMLDRLHSMDAITTDYFYTFLQFVEREHFESKMSDSRPDTTRSLSSLWLADTDTKIENGDILLNLRILDLRINDGVEAICLEWGNESVQANFRIGDSVILYHRNTPADTAVSQHVVRCSVEEYESDRIWLKLKNNQRDTSIFPSDSLYAIEHDHVESSFGALYANLFSLVTCSKRRRDLVLCQREPEENELFLLVGPPGTGKTSVSLKRMVEQHMGEHHNILLLSYTNRAVDEICGMLDTIEPHPSYVRLGRELSCAPDYRSHLLPNVLNGMNNRQLVVNLIDATSIFVSTVSSMQSHAALLKLKHFDVAIFDEASQILEPQLMGIMTSPSIDSFIMIGDHKQLPAVVVQDDSKSEVTSERLRSIGLTNCRNSFFERLYEQNRHNSKIVSMLDCQGRMHPDIAEFPSAVFYEHLLKPVGLPHQCELLPYAIYDESDPVETIVATRRCAFINVPCPTIEERIPKANVLEARMIAQIVRSVCEVNKRNDIAFNPSAQLGVIVPFRRQITAVRAEVAHAFCADGYTEAAAECLASGLLIDTVERYQGSQRDVIIYGTTITQSYELDMLSNIVTIASADVDRKLNVAITRARKQLFVLGNRQLLSQNALYKKLIDYCDSRR